MLAALRKLAVYIVLALVPEIIDAVRDGKTQREIEARMKRRAIELAYERSAAYRRGS